jgi:carboxypeptidase family protein/TonB-dependent receptor-like protein
MMTLPRFLRVVGPSLFFVLGCACAVVAQTETATVSGLVTDRTAAAVSGAEVRLQSVERGTGTTTTTNNAGIYVFPSVHPGQYQISVHRQGFKQVDLLGLIVNVQDHIEQNFRLEVGSVAESVTVEAGASMINTTDASVSTVVDQTYVQNMPLNGRSFQDLILLTPGVVTQTPQVTAMFGLGLGETGEFSVNGQRTESNYYTVDGVSANLGAAAGTNMTLSAAPSGSLPAATAFGTTQALVSVDDLQEFRVQSSTYSAEYGRNPGGQFAFETKSGANQWHGAAYDYLRNGAVDAKDWFNDYFGLPEPPVKQNDFGGTLGGPVKVPRLYNGKDKTFFFVSYEGLRLTAPQPASTSGVPDLCLRGATTNCPAGIHAAPSALQPVLNAFPVQNGPEILRTVSCDPSTDPACSPGGTKQVPSGQAKYIASWSNPSSLDSVSVRLDHVVNDKLRLFFRFSDTGSNSVTRFQPTVVSPSAYTLRTYTAGATSIFSNRLSNEFRLNYSSNDVTGSQVIEAFGGSTPVDLLKVSGLGPNSASTVNFFFGLFPFLSQFGTSGAQKQWNLVDTASFAVGRHQFKLGVDYRRLAPVAAPWAVREPYFFTSESAVEANKPLTNINSFAPAYPLYKNFSAFAQDEWRLSQRLSFSLGLRWEVNPAPGVTKGLNGYTVQGSGPSTWTLAAQGTPLWATAWYNFAPRFGVAYVLHAAAGRETVVRGGAGVFYDTGQQMGALTFHDGPGFASHLPLHSAAFPVNAAGQVPQIVNPPVAPYSGLVGYSSHLQLPYTLQWNASVEQALGRSQAFTVSYVAAHASRLLQENDFHPTNNPNTSNIEFVQGGLTSDYGSLQVQFRRRLSRGLTTLASYTWSHCIDYGSENYNFAYQRGNCDFDVRNNFSAAFSYDLPNVGHTGFVGAMMHHWGLDNRFTARTGIPVTLIGNPLPQPDGKIYDSGLSFVPGQPIYLYGSNCAAVLQGLGDLGPGQGCPGGRAINPNAFTAVNSGLGDTPRNFARGFGAWQMDLAIRRDFPIHEGLKLQFRTEAFNILNHPNFGSIDPNFGSGTFGQATATLASSLGVLSPLYQQGGPRSMQFALKLVF